MNADLSPAIDIQANGRYILRHNDTLELYFAWITIYSTALEYRLAGVPDTRLVEKTAFLHKFTPIEYLPDGTPPDLEDME